MLSPEPLLWLQRWWPITATWVHCEKTELVVLLPILACLGKPPAVVTQAAADTEVMVLWSRTPEELAWRGTGRGRLDKWITSNTLSKTQPLPAVEISGEG